MLKVKSRLPTGGDKQEGPKMDNPNDYTDIVNEIRRKKTDKAVEIPESLIPQQLKEFYITEGAVEKMKAMMRIYKRLNDGKRIEFYGYFLRKPELETVQGANHPIFLVRDFYLPGPQENDPADVDITEEGLDKIASEIPSGLVPIDWTHTHPYLCKRPSGKDNNNNPKVLYALAPFNVFENEYDKIILRDIEKEKDLESRIEGNRLVISSDFKGETVELEPTEQFAHVLEEYKRKHPSDGIFKAQVNKKPSRWVFTRSIIWSGDDEKDSDVYIEVVCGKIVNGEIKNLENPLNKSSLKMNIVRGPEYQLKIDENELEKQLREKCVIYGKKEKKEKNSALVGPELYSRIQESLKKVYETEGVDGLKKVLGKNAEPYVNYYNQLFSGDVPAQEIIVTTQEESKIKTAARTVWDSIARFWLGSNNLETK